MFDVAEKALAVSQALNLSESVKPHTEQEDPAKSVHMIQALANYIERTSSANSAEVLQSVEKLLDEGHTSQALQQVLVYMVNLGAESGSVSSRVYTTGDLAKFFGVSVATINNWLNQRRFHGVAKGDRFKQARIPETAIYYAPTGQTSTIAEAAERYELEQQRVERTKPLTAIEELADLSNAVIHFEKKYGGPLEETLNKKPQLSPSEVRDAEQWNGLLRSIDRRLR